MAEPQINYDVYLSYNDSDRRWVRSDLLPALELAGFKVYVAFRDAPAATPKIETVEQAVDQSRRTIVVLTPAWLNDEWNQLAALLTRTRDPAARRRKLIPLLLADCDIPEHIAMLEQIDMRAEPERPQQMQRLIRSIADIVPVTFPGSQRDWTLWRRWLRRYRRELRRAALGVVGVYLLIAAATQFWPFQTQTGFQRLGDPPYTITGATSILTIGNVLLVGTDTNFTGCSTDTGIWRSDDRSVTIHHISAPLQLYPEQSCSPLAMVESFAASPRLPMRIFAATSDVGLLRSTDVGLTWSRVIDPALAQKLGHVVVLPNAPNTVVATGLQAGLYGSTDGGEHWRQLDGISADCAPGLIRLPSGIRLKALTAGDTMLFAGTDGDTFKPAPHAGLYGSADGGICWELLHNGDQGIDQFRYESLAAVPGNPDQVLALVYAYNNTTNHQRYQLWRVQQNQPQPQLLWPSESSLTAVYVDPRAPQTWFLVNNAGTLFRNDPTNGTAQKLADLTQCFPALGTCWTALAQDFDQPTPLLLANNHIYRVGDVPWYRYLWP